MAGHSSRMAMSVEWSELGRVRNLRAKKQETKGKHLLMQINIFPEMSIGIFKATMLRKTKMILKKISILTCLEADVGASGATSTECRPGGKTHRRQHCTQADNGNWLLIIKF